MALLGSQGNFLGFLYPLVNKYALFSQVYSTTGKQVLFLRNTASTTEAFSWPTFLWNKTQQLRQLLFLQNLNLQQHHLPRYRVLMTLVPFPFLCHFCNFHSVYTIPLWRSFTLAVLGVCPTYQRKGDLTLFLLRPLRPLK